MNIKRCIIVSLDTQGGFIGTIRRLGFERMDRENRAVYVRGGLNTKFLEDNEGQRYARFTIMLKC